MELLRTELWVGQDFLREPKVWDSRCGLILHDVGERVNLKSEEIKRVRLGEEHVGEHFSRWKPAVLKR